MSRIVLEDWNLANAERVLCFEALCHAGSISEAAQLLGINRHALKRKMLKHRIEWPRAPEPTVTVVAAGSSAIEPSGIAAADLNGRITVKVATSPA